MSSFVNRRRGFSFFVLKLCLTLLAVAIIYKQGIFAAAWRQITTIDPGFVFLAVALGTAQTMLGALRWRNILALLGAPVVRRDALQLFYIAVFFNTFVWGGVSGDVLRGWLTYRAGIAPADAVHSVILDRVAAVAGVAFLMLFTIPWLAWRIGSNLVLLPLSAAAMAIFLAIALISQLDHLPARWQGGRLVQLLHGIGGATRRTLFSVAAVPVFAVATLAQIAFALATYSLARALGIESGVLDCLALMPPVALLIAMPISLGGWGVREAAMIGLFGLINVAAAQALLLAVSLGLLAQLVTLPGGAVWLFWREITPPVGTARS